MAETVFRLALFLRNFLASFARNLPLPLAGEAANPLKQCESGEGDGNGSELLRPSPSNLMR